MHLGLAARTVGQGPDAHREQGGQEHAQSANQVLFRSDLPPRRQSFAVPVVADLGGQTFQAAPQLLVILYEPVKKVHTHS